MNAYQLKELGMFLSLNSGEFHHGDCVGVDVQAARLAAHFGYTVVSHPPKEDILRAFHKSTIILPPLGYLERDKRIVDAVDLLLVVPKENQWQPRGGTWYTHDYAKKRGVPRIVIFPDPVKAVYDEV